MSTIRTSSIVAVFLFLILACTTSGCKKESHPTDPKGCLTTQPPLIMMHGALASGDTYATQFQRFTSNRFCPDRLFVFDWNTLDRSINHVELLDAFITQVLNRTGAGQVYLAGHSAGGSLGYEFLGDPARASRVAKYIHIGSGTQAKPAGPEGAPIPTLNIWSPDDAIVPGGDIPGATNARLPGKDHYEVATCKPAFDAMYLFLTGESPLNDIQPESQIIIGGRAVTLGENTPEANASIRIYKTNPANGRRLSATPDTSLQTDANGYWKEVRINSEQTYELEIIPSSGGRTLHYYREPFVRSDALVYLRTIPSGGGGLVGLLLGGLPDDDSQGIVVVFTANQAVIHGRDELRVNENVLSTPEFTSASSTTIAMFLYDGNNNQRTDLSPIGLFALVPAFLKGVDMYFNVGENQSTEVRLNGRSLYAVNWPSKSEGISIVVMN